MSAANKKSCDPDKCSYCQYVGDGGFLCDKTGKRMQWIDVNDTKKLPQHEKPYIVNLTSIESKKSENAFAKYDCELDVWQLCNDYGTLFGPDGTAYYSPDMNAELTHWMEQPKPPKEDADV